jgi:hypothetical protein
MKTSLQCIYDVSLNFSQREKCDSRKLYRKSIQFIINNFFPENPAGYDIMWKHTAEPDRPQMKMYRVSIKSLPDYKHLLQENYVEYKHIF